MASGRTKLDRLTIQTAQLVLSMKIYQRYWAVIVNLAKEAESALEFNPAKDMLVCQTFGIAEVESCAGES